ncbi:MAG: hypothetical protein KC731_38165, partial [Myxococcales bacterium]|nr:hypothetical protein [Myxococcales bacterium]
RPCGTDVGICSMGVEQCVGGVYGACEGGVMPELTELCDGSRDDNCDGRVDEDCQCALGDTEPCGSDTGQCERGLRTCGSDGVFGACLGAVGPTTETCNGLDDDCDGIPDDNPIDDGSACGQSNLFPCQLGTEQCLGGTLVCIGAVNPGVEICNGIDDDCDGGIDSTMGNPPSDAGAPCNVPPPPPVNATSPCQAGVIACIGGVLSCQGSQGPTGPSDACGDDSNCDGVLTGQPDTMTDVNNCGSCGNNCYAMAVNNTWSCAGGVCQNGGCLPGFHDLDMNGTCEYGPCLATGPETCDGLDNDCNGTVDDIQPGFEPTPVDVCGVSPAATRPECTTGVNVACVSGTWQCTFPANVCSPNCAAAVEVCDNLDNDCDGGLNENVSNYGQTCASDDGLPFPGHGACRTQGTFVCNGPNATVCSAVKGSCSGLPGGCTELCDGVDNDCDGSVDEPFTAKGSDPAFFVQPAVTRIQSQLWVYSYEASRPGATGTSPGSGNGYHCTGGNCPSGIPDAPSGVVLDGTYACSVPDVLPWFNVTPIEVEQTCDAMGGFICDLSEWQLACGAGNGCDWGYNPSGAACQLPATGSKFCNLEPFDFSASTSGNQDGLLATASNQLANCWADWTSGPFPNTDPEIFDLTGNLREITKNGSGIYPLMGGAYNSPQYGATCDFDFYVVDDDFKLLDTGFRCCFDSDPRL